MRARAGAKGLAIGRRSRGRAAVRERERSDGWGYPVSGCERERGRGRAQRGCGPEAVGRSAAQFPSSPLRSNLFLFLFMQFLIYIWICVVNFVLIQKLWEFLYSFLKMSRTHEKYLVIFSGSLHVCKNCLYLIINKSSMNFNNLWVYPKIMKFNMWTCVTVI
jgi:hypothetical protein